MRRARPSVKPDPKSHLLRPFHRIFTAYYIRIIKDGGAVTGVRWCASSEGEILLCALFNACVNKG